MSVEIEVTGAQPVPERPERGGDPRGVWKIALALVAGLALGYAFAVARPAPPVSVGAPIAPAAAATPAAEAGPQPLTREQTDTMLRRVREYNKAEPDAVESTPERFMTGRRDNLLRLDDDRRLPAGEYRLQVICLGDGQVWALLRIGDDETYVDMDCHAEHVLVSQLLLSARAEGRRTVTAVTDSPLGVVLGLQILRRG